MFTGLIEEVGTVRRLVPQSDGAHLEIAASRVLDGVRVGDSIAVSGPCLTVVEVTPSGFVADCMAETLARSTLGSLRPGARVNLERALAVGDRLGGHLVAGHVDGVGVVRSVGVRGIASEVRISLPAALRPYVAPKGSVAVDGISLTVIEVGREDFVVGIIPHTLGVTTLGHVRPGDRVNLEADLLARYVERALFVRGQDEGGGQAADGSPGDHETPPRGRGSVTEAFLREHGF